MKKEKMMERRGFLKKSTAGLFGVGIVSRHGLGPSGQKEKSGPRSKTIVFSGARVSRCRTSGVAIYKSPA